MVLVDEEMPLEVSLDRFCPLRPRPRNVIWKKCRMLYSIHDCSNLEYPRRAEWGVARNAPCQEDRRKEQWSRTTGYSVFVYDSSGEPLSHRAQNAVGQSLQLNGRAVSWRRRLSSISGLQKIICSVQNKQKSSTTTAARHCRMRCEICFDLIS